MCDKNRTGWENDALVGFALPTKYSVQHNLSFNEGAQILEELVAVPASMEKRFRTIRARFATVVDTPTDFYEYHFLIPISSDNPRFHYPARPIRAQRYITTKSLEPTQPCTPIMKADGTQVQYRAFRWMLPHWLPWIVCLGLLYPPRPFSVWSCLTRAPKLVGSFSVPALVCHCWRWGSDNLVPGVLESVPTASTCSGSTPVGQLVHNTASTVGTPRIESMVVTTPEGSFALRLVSVLLSVKLISKGQLVLPPALVGLSVEKSSLGTTPRIGFLTVTTPEGSFALRLLTFGVGVTPSSIRERL